MEQIKSELSSLLNDFEDNLVKINQSSETGDSLDSLKRKSIQIEMGVSQCIDRLRCCINEEGSVISDRRNDRLQSELESMGVNLEQMKGRSREAVNKARNEIVARKRQSTKERREKLLGEDASSELQRSISLKNQGVESLASNITTRLERTRTLIKSQVAESHRAINLMKESTEELQGIGEASRSVGNAQNRADRALRKLKRAQRIDRMLFNSSLIFFALVACYVVYRRIQSDFFVLLGKRLWHSWQQRKQTVATVDQIPNRGAIEEPNMPPNSRTEFPEEVDELDTGPKFLEDAALTKETQPKKDVEL